MVLTGHSVSVHGYYQSKKVILFTVRVMKVKCILRSLYLLILSTNKKVYLGSDTSKFNNIFYCKSHEGEVYFKKQGFTPMSNK